METQLHADLGATCPLAPSAENTANPYLLVEEFFYFTSICDYKKNLQTWFSCALSDQAVSANASDMLFLHDQVIKLVQAGYVIATNNIAYVPECHTDDRTMGDWMKGIKGNSICEITTLLPHERLEPLVFLKNTLTLQDLKTIRYGLYEWLTCALCRTVSMNEFDAKYSLPLYETVVKVMEAFYLILTSSRE